MEFPKRKNHIKQMELEEDYKLRSSGDLIQYKSTDAREVDDIDTAKDDAVFTPYDEKQINVQSPKDCPFLSADWDDVFPSKLCLTRITR